MTLAPPPLDELAARIDALLDELLPPVTQRDDGVAAAMRMAALGPGKRLRPLLVVLTGEAFGCRAPALFHAGCAVEFVHAASLILDDLPCMDDAELRRGRPALHKAHGEAAALLATVGLLSHSVQVLLRAPGLDDAARCRLALVLHEAVGPDGLVAGQLRDLRAERGREVDELKTGVLFAAALEMGAVIAGRAARAAPLRAAGLELGRVFQLRDDLDDLAQDQREGVASLDAAHREVRAAAERCAATLHAAFDGPSRLAEVVGAYFRVAGPVPVGRSAVVPAVTAGR